MDLLTLLLGLPLAPVRGLISIAEILREQAEQELYDPNVARRQLEELSEQRSDGEISADEEAEKQQQILDRMLGQDGAQGRDADVEYRNGADRTSKGRGTGG
jgi:hypothetical protein